VMEWKKRGLIFSTSMFDKLWIKQYAAVPVCDLLGEETLRIYFSTRDEMGRSIPTYIDVARDNPQQIKYIHSGPILELGKLGEFDDRGIMPTWIETWNDIKYLYYIGWNEGKYVPYHNSIGLAISTDGGETFKKKYSGPLLDRSPYDQQFTASCCTLIENGIWRMWYLSATKWEIIDNRPEPFYNIKYAESTDGLNWRREGVTCIDYNPSKEGGISRPTVIREGGVYKMWYSYRGFKNYRNDKNYSYRIGYAESDDGILWERKDNQVGIDVSVSGWDSQMIAYSHVISIGGSKMMFYNGNCFGKTGLGYAILDN
jgi:hypothetical protein